MVSTTAPVTLGFKGVINSIKFYNYFFTAVNADDSVSFACNSYCNVCRAEDYGRCIEAYTG